MLGVKNTNEYIHRICGAADYHADADEGSPDDSDISTTDQI